MRLTGFMGRDSFLYKNIVLEKRLRFHKITLTFYTAIIII